MDPYSPQYDFIDETMIEDELRLLDEPTNFLDRQELVDKAKEKISNNKENLLYISLKNVLYFQSAQTYNKYLTELFYNGLFNNEIENLIRSGLYEIKMEQGNQKELYEKVEQIIQSKIKDTKESSKSEMNLQYKVLLFLRKSTSQNSQSISSLLDIKEILRERFWFLFYNEFYTEHHGLSIQGFMFKIIEAISIKNLDDGLFGLNNLSRFIMKNDVFKAFS